MVQVDDALHASTQSFTVDFVVLAASSVIPHVVRYVESSRVPRCAHIMHTRPDADGAGGGVRKRLLKRLLNQMASV